MELVVESTVFFNSAPIAYGVKGRLSHDLYELYFQFELVDIKDICKEFLLLLRHPLRLVAPIPTADIIVFDLSLLNWSGSRGAWRSLLLLDRLGVSKKVFLRHTFLLILINLLFLGPFVRGKDIVKLVFLGNMGGVSLCTLLGVIIGDTVDFLFNRVLGEGVSDGQTVRACFLFLAHQLEIVFLGHVFQYFYSFFSWELSND